VTPTIKAGSPGSPTWDWLTSYFLGVMDSLGRIPPLTAGKAARLRAQWRAAARVRTSLLIAPAVLDIVARKPR
jgi:hypothetical protein